MSNVDSVTDIANLIIETRTIYWKHTIEENPLDITACICYFEYLILGYYLLSQHNEKTHPHFETYLRHYITAHIFLSGGMLDLYGISQENRVIFYREITKKYPKVVESKCKIKADGYLWNR